MLACVNVDPSFYHYDEPSPRFRGYMKKKKKDKETE